MILACPECGEEIKTFSIKQLYPAYHIPENIELMAFCTKCEAFTKSGSTGCLQCEKHGKNTYEWIMANFTIVH